MHRSGTVNQWSSISQWMNGVQLSWQLLNIIEEYRIQAMEMRCYRKILRISNRDHATNKEVQDPADNPTTRRSPDHCPRVICTVCDKTAEQLDPCCDTSVVSMCLAFILSKATTTPVQKTTNACDVWLICMLVEWVSWRFEPSQPQRITSGLRELVRE